MTNLSSLRSSGLRIIATNTYSANDTWTKPANAAWVRVVLCGGGGSGARPTANTADGVGGTAAPIVEVTFPASALGATESITVGAGGTAVSTNATAGNNGGYSAFGSWAECMGGLGGLLNTVAAHAPPLNPRIPNLFVSRTSTVSDGIGAAKGGAAGYDGASQIIGGGGGSCGANGSAVGFAGGASQRFRSITVADVRGNGSAGGTTGGATGGAGTAGAAGNIAGMLGGGGGGAGGGGSTTGGVGGAGGAPGGGGGGGGFGTTTSGNSGAGGVGGVYVETWG
jgi:hypothetical protein